MNRKKENRDNDHTNDELNRLLDDENFINCVNGTHFRIYEFYCFDIMNKNKIKFFIMMN